MLKTSAIIVSGIIITMLSLTGCASKFAPQVNPHPKYFLTVSGHIDPVLAKNLKIAWVGEYLTHNPKCEYVASWEYGKTMRYTSVKFPPILPNKDGYYSAKIPMDYYSRGFCDWEMGSLAYEYTYKEFNIPPNATTAIGFAKTGKIESKPMNQVWLCTKLRCQLTNDSTTSVAKNLSSRRSIEVRVSFRKPENNK